MRGVVDQGITRINQKVRSKCVTGGYELSPLPKIFENAVFQATDVDKSSSNYLSSCGSYWKLVRIILSSGIRFLYLQWFLRCSHGTSTKAFWRSNLKLSDISFSTSSAVRAAAKRGNNMLLSFSIKLNMYHYNNDIIFKRILVWV